MKNLIVTITGPSCAGKTTLEAMLCDKLGFERVISTTTRPMREGDVDGVAYYFMIKEEFEWNARLGSFVETVMFNGNLYGVSAGEINRVHQSGKPVVVVVEPNGQKQIVDYAKTVGWNVYSIFVCNPPEVIAERFLNRFEEELAHKTDSMIDKIVLTYSSRLGTMMSTEIAWQFEAARITPASPYTLTLWRFNEKNSDSVLDTIRAEAMKEEASTCS